MWDRCPQREETRAVLSLSINTVQQLSSGSRARASRWGHLSHRDCVARLAAFVGPLSSAGRNSRGAKPEHEYSAAAAFKHQSKSFQVGTPVPQELRSEVMPLLWDRCPQREGARTAASLSMNILQRLSSGIRARASRWGHLSHRDYVARLAAFVGPLSSAGRNSHGGKPEHLSINTVQPLYSSSRARASRWGQLSHRSYALRCDSSFRARVSRQ